MLPDSIQGGDGGKGDAAYRAFFQGIQYSAKVRLELAEEQRRSSIISSLVLSILVAVDSLLDEEEEVGEGEVVRSLSCLGLKDFFNSDELKAAEQDLREKFIPFLKNHIAAKCQQVQRKYQEIVVTFGEIKIGEESQDYGMLIVLKK